MEELKFSRVVTQDRRAEVARLGDIIWHECYAEILSLGQIDYMVEKFQSEAAITRQTSQEGYEYYLVGTAGESFGYLGLVPCPQEGRLMISKIYLLAQQRGNGWAKQMLDFAATRANQLHCGQIWLTVNRNNARAVAAYQKNGFLLAGRQDADIGSGYVMEDFVLEKSV